MRKLKLQMQITADGYVAGPEGQLDWMTFDMDQELLACINHPTDTLVARPGGGHQAVELVASIARRTRPPPVRSWDRPRPWLPRALSHSGAGGPRQ